MSLRSRQGRAVAHALENLDHPTADEVFHAVRRHEPKVSLATVYRNLDALVAQGEAQVRHVGTQKRYDPLTDPHVHLHCTRCDRLTDVPLEGPLLNSLHRLADEADMEFKDALLEVRVHCPQCKETKP
jgi:Fur family transcriptional regulator, ferric uptake regulator